MKKPFASPAASYAGAAPSTPYQRAAQEWDRRMGAAVMSARGLLAIVAALLMLCAALGVALTIVALQQRTFVHVLEVEPSGQVLSVRIAERNWTPTQTQIVFHLGRFVHLIRAIPTDRVVLAQNWRDAYKFLTPQAAARMSEIASAEDPSQLVGNVARTVEIRSVVKRSDGAWEVNWSERGADPASQHYVGVFSVVIRPPRNADEVASNPLGLLISDFSWSRVR